MTESMYIHALFAHDSALACASSPPNAPQHRATGCMASETSLEALDMVQGDNAEIPGLSSTRNPNMLSKIH